MDRGLCDGEDHVLWAQTQNEFLQPGGVYAMTSDRTTLTDCFFFSF